MGRRFLHGCLRRPVTVTMFYGIVLCMGVFALTRIPLELAPDIEFPILTIRSTWGNSSPETVERLVTSPVEEIATTIGGVTKVSSISREGDSEVHVRFEERTDMNFARLELTEKLAALAETLPPGVSPPMIEPYVPKDFKDLQGFVSYSLVGTEPLSRLRVIAKDVIAPRLLSVKGVGRVDIVGGEEREIQIELDNNKLLATGVRMGEVADAVASTRYTQPVGSLDSKNGRRVVSIENPNLTLSEIEEIPIGWTARGSHIRVRDVAVVHDGASEPESYYRIDGKPSVTIVIDKEPGTNTLVVADEVFATIEDLCRRLPGEMTLVKESDKSQRMRDELERLYIDIVFSLACIWIILLVFLRDIRGPIILYGSILFSLAGTIVILWIAGMSLNLLTLGGLVLGLGRLVDDSIVVMDNIQRHVEQGRNASVIVEAVGEIALPIAASTLTTIAALAPLAFLPYDLKPYFQGFAVAVGVSLMISLVVAVTIVPVAFFYRIPPSGSKKIFENKATVVYRQIMMRAMTWRKSVVVAAILMFGVPVWTLPEKMDSDDTLGRLYNSTLGPILYSDYRPYIVHLLGGCSYLFFEHVTIGEPLDYGSSTYIIVSVEFPQGTDIDRYNDVCSSVEHEIKRFGPGVQKTTASVSRDRGVIKIEFGDLVTSTPIPALVMNTLTAFAVRTGGASIGVSGFGPGFYTGSRSYPSFVVNVLGYNYERVKEIAGSLRKTLELNPRVTDVNIDASMGKWALSHELVAEVHRTSVAKHGLDMADVIQSIRLRTQSRLAQNFLTIRGERVPYVVRFEGTNDVSVDDLLTATITNGSGTGARLKDLVEITTQRTQPLIIRENQQYSRLVSFTYLGPLRSGFTYLNRTLDAFTLPNGYSFARSVNEFTFSGEERRSLMWIAVFAVIAVYMVTASLYESLTKPFVVILSIPLSFVGVFLAFYLTGEPFGRGGYASVLLLTGIVVTNSVVLVDFIARQCMQQGESISVVVGAATKRLRPVLMTSLTTIGGMIPLLVAEDRTSMWYSLSLGAIGGMITSTILTLLIVPLVYAMIYRIRR